MRHCLKRLLVSATLVALAATSGCAVRSVPISQSSERELKGNEVSAKKLGFRVMPGGGRYAMQIFRASLPNEPVELPMVRSVSRLPAVTVKLNGRQSVPMIVDTGAQLSVVEASRAIAAGAEVFAPKEGTLRVTGVGGEERAWLARFDSARFGPIDLKGLVTVLRRQTSELQFGGVSVSRIEVNLIGAPVLTAFSFVTFDYPAGRIVFSGGAPFVPSRGARRIPLTVRSSLPYVSLRVGARTIQALVDTGARDQLFLNDKVVREWGLEAAAAAGKGFKAAGLGGMITGTQFNLPLIHLGGVPVRDVLVDTSTGPWPARIGSELLERWRTTFDFRADALWIEGPGE